MGQGKSKKANKGGRPGGNHHASKRTEIPEIPVSMPSNPITRTSRLQEATNLSVTICSLVCDYACGEFYFYGSQVVGRNVSAGILSYACSGSYSTLQVPFTVSLWLKPDTGKQMDNARLFSNVVSEMQPKGLCLMQKGNNEKELMLQWGNGKSWHSSPGLQIEKGRLQRICISVSENKVFMINFGVGNAENAAVISREVMVRDGRADLDPGSAPFRLGGPGQFYTWQPTWQGEVSDVRIYSRGVTTEKSALALLANHNRDSLKDNNLVGWWSCSENTCRAWWPKSVVRCDNWVL